jgi:hypothetical protein
VRVVQTNENQGAAWSHGLRIVESSREHAMHGGGHVAHESTILLDATNSQARGNAYVCVALHADLYTGDCMACPVAQRLNDSHAYAS